MLGLEAGQKLTGTQSRWSPICFHLKVLALAGARGCFTVARKCAVPLRAMWDVFLFLLKMAKQKLKLNGKNNNERRSPGSVCMRERGKEMTMLKYPL